MKELLTLYKECFPDRVAENEIKALGSNFKFDILEGKCFVIYIVSSDEAEIIDIGTVPSARNQGLAQKLIKNLCEKLKTQGTKVVFLEVAENNASGVNLYKKTGFEAYNRRKGYYSIQNNRIDAILMKKTLGTY